MYKENTCPRWNYSLGADAENKVYSQILIIKVSTTIFEKYSTNADLSFHFFVASFLDVLYSP